MAYIPKKYVEVSHFKPDERPLAEAMFENMKTLNIVRDHAPILVLRGEVKDKLTYVSEYDSDEDLVIAIDERAMTYTRSMEDVWHARDDFRAGWRAYEKMVKAREEAQAAAWAAKEAAKPKFAIHDAKYDEYVVIENDTFTRMVYNAHNATVWKTKAAAMKALNRFCPGDRLSVININEKKGDK